MNINLCSDIDRLNCSSCNNFLSYFPISVSKDKFICGRCPKSDKASRLEFYEAIAEVHRFNCRYKKEGCPFLLYPIDVPDHEGVCPFHPATCIVPSCSWHGGFAHMINHCTTEHSSLIITNDEFFDIKFTSKKFEKIFVDNDNLLLVELKFNLTSGELECSILHHVKAIKKQMYNFQFTLESGEVAITKDVEIGGTVGIPCLDISEEFAGAGKIFFGSNESQTDETRNITTTLSCLQCSKCSNYVLPPIYSDDEGSIFCKSCTEDNTSLYNLNTALNKMVETIAYFCPNSKNGCNFSGFPNLIEKHQAECEFQVIKCMLPECQWEEQKNELFNHFQNEHQIYENPSVVTCTLTWPKTAYKSEVFLFTFDNMFFVFVLTVYKARYICCSVETIKPTNSKFKYKIKILDPTTFKYQLLAQKSCPGFTSFDDNKRTLILNTDHFNNDKYCTFSYDQLQSCTEEIENKEMLYLQIKILKIDDDQTTSL